MFRSAFTPEECARIAQLFWERPPELDARTIPLLPNMEHDQFRVARVNRFDDGTLGSRGKLDFIFLRLAALLHGSHASPLLAVGGIDVDALRSVGASTDSIAAAARNLRARVAFTLLHEFTPRPGDPSPQFDWHADTKPGDGKARSLNVNVMLSAPGVDFEGGDLQVGSTRVAAQQGDMYLYPAAVVHRVAPILNGTRLTLVVALEDIAADGDGVVSDDGRSSLARRRELYWAHVEASYQRLATGPLANESKLHILHGEFLEGAGRNAEAHAAFCRAYAAMGEDAASAHARQFFSDGVSALQRPQGPDLHLAERYFSMAVCISPELEDAADALSVVRDAILQVDAKSKTHGAREERDEL